MTTTAKILDFDGEMLTIMPTIPIDRELLKKHPDYVEIRVHDGRSITNDQRAKIFAIIRDISIWSGDDPETIRGFFTWDFVGRFGGECFSLSDVDMTTARHFITYLIDFCLRWNVPTKRPLMEHADEVGRYLYGCLEHRKCAICGKVAEVHHVDRIGMGRDRETVVHVGLKAIALCREHHNKAHEDEADLFEAYHVHGIELDEYLCKKLRLGKGEDRK